MGRGAAGCTGVQVQMRPQEAQFACPAVILRPIDVAAAQEIQDAFLAQAATWQLPVEPQAWGMAYLDLHTVAKNRAAVQPLAAEMGRLVRRIGVSLQPAIGWDSGKFTARVAALQVPPGRMRLVDQADEVRFLRPQPISLLPLPRQHLQQLHWLGVRTLGQFATLPVAAVWQRFGAMGKVAQRWAQGRDDRPVRACVAHAPAAMVLAFDPPEARLQPVVEALLAALQPGLGGW
ncbi:MAG: hypothetical protein IPK16_23610 [Anaerolineales bacterium]|nr:hypothetical protein [Anaerolineales bacterium]